MSEWKEVQLCDTCNLIAGYAFKSKDFGDYPTKVIKIADINPPFVSSDNSSGVNLLNYNVTKLKKYVVKKGDYLLAMTGATIGKLGRYISDEQVYLNQRVLRFEPHKSIDSDFLYYILCGRQFSKYIVNHIDSESAQPNISAGTIGKFLFRIPEIDTQRRIASILSSLDDKISVNKKICENLEAQAQALFKHWFIDFAPFKDGKFVESELGMIPEGWRVGKAEDFYSINIGKTPPRAQQQWFSESKNNNKIWISISDMGNCGAFISDSKEYLTPEAQNKFNIIMVPIGTILLSFKLTIGRVAIANEELTTNEAIARFILPSTEYREFTYLYLKQYKYGRLGSTSSIATAVNSKIIKSMLLLMPTTDVIKGFSSITSKLFDEIKTLTQESSRLSTLRDTLLPRLMSGQIKL